MHALVTGAAGFLGLYIVEQLLRRGDQVTATVRRDSAALAATGARVVKLDLVDRKAVLREVCHVDAVFHVAGKAGLGGRWQSYHAANTLATEHILEACRAHGIGRLVFTSSPSVTFTGEDQAGVDERARYPQTWLCHYQHSKALAEQQVLAANDPTGLKTCALRPHLIWGPRDSHLLPRLLERARRGRLRQVGDGQNLIDTIYVENAAEAHLLAADALTKGTACGKAYFLSQGTPVPCWEWIATLLKLGGAPPVKHKVGLNTAWRMGALLELVYRTLRLSADPPMTRFLAAQLGKSHYFDIGAARKDLGYEPRISTEEGLRRLQAWLIDRQKKP